MCSDPDCKRIEDINKILKQMNEERANSPLLEQVGGLAVALEHMSGDLTAVAKNQTTLSIDFKELKTEVVGNGSMEKSIKFKLEMLILTVGNHIKNHKVVNSRIWDVAQPILLIILIAWLGLKEYGK